MVQRHEPESPEPCDDAPDEQAKVHHVLARLETMVPVTPLSAEALKTSLQSSSSIGRSTSSPRRGAAAGDEANLAEAVLAQPAMLIAENGEHSAANIPEAATTENQDDLTVKKAHTEQPPTAATKVVERANAKEEKKKRDERVR